LIKLTPLTMCPPNRLLRMIMMQKKVIDNL
jgi:hypothetical protein